MRLSQHILQVLQKGLNVVSGCRTKGVATTPVIVSPSQSRDKTFSFEPHLDPKHAVTAQQHYENLRDGCCRKFLQYSIGYILMRCCKFYHIKEIRKLETLTKSLQSLMQNSPDDSEGIFSPCGILSIARWSQFVKTMSKSSLVNACISNWSQVADIVDMIVDENVRETKRWKTQM